MPPIGTHSRGYLIERDRITGKVRREADTYTCGHCGGIQTIPPRARPEDCGGLCKVCMQLTCPRCTAAGRCTPFEARITAYEDRMRFRTALSG